MRGQTHEVSMKAWRAVLVACACDDRVHVRMILLLRQIPHRGPRCRRCRRGGP